MSEAILFPLHVPPEEGAGTRPENTAVNEANSTAIIPTLLPSVRLEDMPAYQAHMTALEALHPYPGTVVSRTSEGMRRPKEYAYATIYEEKVTFTDGAVRTLTHAIPKQAYFGKDGVSKFPISATDALMTGPSGFNANVIDELVKLGYPVVWLHHQGRHSEKPTSPHKIRQLAKFVLKKSVGRSAHHQHGLFDDLGYTAEYDTNNIISIGDSRGAMTGEAVDALADMYKRNIVWSDYIAGCFEHKPKGKEYFPLALTPYKEAKALGKLASRLVAENGDIQEALKMLGTFDMHPMNVLHEAAWFIPLMRGDAGRYADAVPLDRDGARTYLSGDVWSSRGRSWEAKHSIRPGIHYFQESLPNGEVARHLDLADTSIQRKRLDRLERLRNELQTHRYLASEVDFAHVALGTAS